jgi:anti-sigma B factor antagonist
MRFRSRRAQRRPPAMTHLEEDCQHVTLPQRLDFAAVSESSLANDVLVGDKNCLVELGNVKFMDSTGVGFLIRLQKRVRAAGRQLILIAPSVEVDRVFGLMHLREYFACAANTAAAKKLINTRAAEQDFIVAPMANPGMLSWRGEITAANSEQVWEETRAYLSALQEEQPQLMIDLREVRFLDSTGVGMMVRAKKLAQRQAVRLQFINPSAAALNVLKVSQLEEFLTGN